MKVDICDICREALSELNLNVEGYDAVIVIKGIDPANPDFAICGTCLIKPIKMIAFQNPFVEVPASGT